MSYDRNSGRVCIRCNGAGCERCDLATVNTISASLVQRVTGVIRTTAHGRIRDDGHETSAAPTRVPCEVPGQDKREPPCFAVPCRFESAAIGEKLRAWFGEFADVSPARRFYKTGEKTVARVSGAQVSTIAKSNFNEQQSRPLNVEEYERRFEELRRLLKLISLCKCGRTCEGDAPLTGAERAKRRREEKKKEALWAKLQKLQKPAKRAVS